MEQMKKLTNAYKNYRGIVEIFQVGVTCQSYFNVKEMVVSPLFLKMTERIRETESNSHILFLDPKFEVRVRLENTKLEFILKSNLPKSSEL